MPSYVPPKKNTQYIFYISLSSQANTNTFQSNPTIASGDFKVSIDGGSLTNLTTLPAVTPASSKMVKITLSTSEMNGDNITIVGSDASGAEWRDIVINIQTSAQQVDDLALQSTANTIAGYLDTEIAAILAAVDTEVAAIKAKTDNLPTDPADASDIATSFSGVNSTLTTIATYIDTEVAAIKAKTDNLPTDPADQSLLIAAIAALNNISVADILAATIEGSLDVKETLRLALAVLIGKSSGGGTTSVAFRDSGDTKNRVAATVDSNGNRTAVTLDTSD